MVNARRVVLTRLRLFRVLAVVLLAGLAGVTGSAQQDPPDADGRKGCKVGYGAEQTPKKSC